MSSCDEYTIRDYRAGDFAAVEDLWRLTGLGSAARGDNAGVIERTLRLGGRLLLLVEASSGTLAGSSWLTGDGRRLYLHHFGIRPELQRRGLGRQLLAASLQAARQIGLQIKLEVHRDNRRAIELYRRGGFARLGDYDVYIRRDLDDAALLRTSGDGD